MKKIIVISIMVFFIVSCSKENINSKEIKANSPTNSISNTRLSGKLFKYYAVCPDLPDRSCCWGQGTT